MENYLKKIKAQGTLLCLFVGAHVALALPRTSSAAIADVCQQHVSLSHRVFWLCERAHVLALTRVALCV